MHTIVSQLQAGTISKRIHCQTPEVQNSTSILLIISFTYMALSDSCIIFSQCQLTQHHSNMGLPKNVQSHTIQVSQTLMFISFFLSLFGVVEILVVIIHYLLELWIYSLKFERAQSVKFLCPRMSPLYYILDGKAQINSSSLIIYRSQFSLAFSSSC